MRLPAQDAAVNHCDVNQRMSRRNLLLRRSEVRRKEAGYPVSMLDSQGPSVQVSQSIFNVDARSVPPDDSSRLVA